jgi:shikimate dehydrogenase
MSDLTQQYTLFAHPAKHSLSPQIHNEGFRVNRLDAVYFVIDTEAAGSEIAAEIRTRPLAGCNLSLPLKETLIPELDEISPTAQLIGAVNTVKNIAGRLIGTNTDGEGLIADIQANNVNLSGKRILLLGGGACARAILVALVARQPLEVTVIQRANRPHFQQVQTLITILQSASEPLVSNLTCVDWSWLASAELESYDLVINATSLGFGAHHAQAPLSIEQLRRFQPTTQIWDVIYEPRETHFLQASRELGLTTHNGLGMLLQQAARSFDFWTGHKLPLAVIEKTLK